MKEKRIKLLQISQNTKSNKVEFKIDLGKIIDSTKN